MKILFLTPYPKDVAPSQRFRFEHFLKYVEKWDFKSFVSAHDWDLLYSQHKKARKIRIVLAGFFRRFISLFSIPCYDIIFIHRELTPFGPPVFEWIIAKVLRKKIIYDFDDAIWLPDQNMENSLWKWLKWRSKVASICKWSWKVSVGNKYLAEFVRRYNQNVVVIPTVVDTEMHKPDTHLYPSSRGDKLCVGWTGSHSTLPYLDMILPALQKLEKKIDFEFCVIANQDPKLPLKNYSFIKWKKETEIEDLSAFDIGVMPLPDDEWSKGKCGFKLIQYLALEIPAVASPVGVNSQIIQHEKNGLLALSGREWVESLARLIREKTLRDKLGKAGRKQITDKFSVDSQKEVFLNLFRD